MAPHIKTGIHAPDPAWLAEWLDTLRATAHFHSIDRAGLTQRRIILPDAGLGHLSDAAAQMRAFVALQQQVAQLEADLDHERAARRQAQGDLADFWSKQRSAPPLPYISPEVTAMFEAFADEVAAASKPQEGPAR